MSEPCWECANCGAYNRTEDPECLICTLPREPVSTYHAVSSSDGGKKFDDGKEPMDLLPWEALQQIAQVLAYGAKKYDRSNWAKGIALSRLISAALRHIFKWLAGEDIDPESGLSHLAHAAANLIFAMWMLQKRPELDDRWIKDVL